MIVSKLKFDFSAVSWAGAGAARAGAQKLFHAVTHKDEVETSARGKAEHLSLGELLYRALVEPMEVAS